MLNLTKKFEVVRCQIHKEKSSAFNFDDSPLPTLCDQCLLERIRSENSNFITYQKLEQLLIKQQWNTEKEYFYLLGIKGDVEKIIDVLISTSKDFQNSFNENLKAHCDMITLSIFIRRQYEQKSFDNFDMIHLRSQIQNLVTKKNNDYVLKGPTDLSKLNQSIQSITNIFQESSRQLQKICDSNNRIQQEQTMVKTELNDQPQITKKQQIQFKQERKINTLNLKQYAYTQDINNCSQIDPHYDQFQKLLEVYFQQSIQKLAPVYKLSTLQQVFFDQSGSIMLTIDANSTLTIWKYTTDQKLIIKQTFLIPQFSKVIFGYRENQQFFICKNQKTIKCQNIDIYNLNEQLDSFEKTHQIQLPKMNWTKLLIQPIKQNQLLILIDGHVNLILLQDGNYVIKLYVQHICNAFYYDPEDEIFYYTRKSYHKIFKSKLNKSDSQVIAIGPPDACYKSLLFIRGQNLLIVYSFVGLLLINVKANYKCRFISFQSQILQMPTIVQDTIIIQTEEGKLFVIQNDNVTASKQFLLQLPQRTYFKYIDHLERIYLVRNQNEVSFTNLDLLEFNHGVNQSLIQKGPQMIMNL